MGVFIIYEEGGDWQMGGGQAEFTPLYRRSERLHSGEEGGKKSLMVCILLCSGF